MRLATLMTMIAPFALAACGNGEKTNQPAETPTAQPIASNMPMAQGQAASGQGVVTAIDANAGSITIDHDAIPAVNWPAMSMTFQAGDQLRQKVAVGDNVTFDFHTTPTGGELTSISKK